jgi:hypothetical protein
MTLVITQIDESTTLSPFVKGMGEVGVKHLLLVVLALLFFLSTRCWDFHDSIPEMRFSGDGDPLSAGPARISAQQERRARAGPSTAGSEPLATV